jgi:LacI family transcriptional regulator
MNRPSRRSRGSVTIEDVARVAGVSAMTVSRVINNKENVRVETREFVLETIEQLKYTPNSAARNLAAGEATHIGLLYSNPSAAYLSQFLVGALNGARNAECHLIIEDCESEDPVEQAEAAQRFVTAQVDGVILPPPLSESPSILKELAQAKTPVVTIAMGRLYENALNVRIDDFAAGKQMTEHLLDLGHRRIALIKGHPVQIASSERERGYRAAMSEAGLTGEIQIAQGYFTFRSGLAAAEELLDMASRPTAIFASNDDMAAAAVSVAHRRGLDVPGDLSIVGFDDTAHATNVWPELTTIRQPVSAMANAAVELLLEEVRNRRRGGAPGKADLVLGHELIIRESSGPSPR